MEAWTHAIADISAPPVIGRFTSLDWLVVFGYLAFTTWLGHRLAGKQATIRDFFLGGRRLPWYAVCGSIIATEISAVTFVGVPAIVFAPAGNLTYLQIGLIGYVLARIIVGYVFVPVYYEREIYSPYDYMANHLGEQARTLTTCLFMLGSLLSQGVRVYLTALILDLVMGQHAFAGIAAAMKVSTVTCSVIVLAIVSTAWTLMGGMTTVIWTDVMLTAVFLIGAVAAAIAVIVALPGGVGDGLHLIGQSAWNVPEAGAWGKFTFFNLSLDPSKPYTLLAALVGGIFVGVAAFGTDQLMAQRIFCCRDPHAARRAIIGSNAGQIITILMAMVGLGLYAYYQQFPLTGEAARLVGEDRDRIFPMFVIQTLPPGINGLIIGAIFAAAISTIMSVLAALAQTTLSAFYLPLRRRGKTVAQAAGVQLDTDRHSVFASRVLVVFWAVALCVMADLAARAKAHFPFVIDLALSMAGYTNGALLAGFLLAFFKLKINARGFLWSGPLSVLLIFALVWHQPWAQTVCWVGAGLLAGCWLAMQIYQGRILREWHQTLVLFISLGVVIWVSRFGWLDRTLMIDTATGRQYEQYVNLAWPWFVPIGSITAFTLGYFLSGTKDPVMDRQQIKSKSATLTAR